MRVVCFHTNLDPRTKASIEAQTPDAEFVYTGDDDYHYWRELDKRWTGESDLVIIEHDMGLRGGELASFACCDKPWCTFGYSSHSENLARSLNWCLGCSKISAQVQNNARVGKAPWGSLDVAVVRATRMPDKQHVHGEVNHFHDYSKPSDAPVDEINFPKQEAIKSTPEVLLKQVEEIKSSVQKDFKTIDRYNPNFREEVLRLIAAGYQMMHAESGDQFIRFEKVI